MANLAVLSLDDNLFDRELWKLELYLNEWTKNLPARIETELENLISLFFLLGMVSSRDAASFLVYFSVFHVFILKFVDSKCPKSFPCGNFGNLEFPLAYYLQPECGLFTVECNAVPHPKVHLNIEWLSPSYEILSNISTSPVLIRNPIIDDLVKSKSCSLFLDSSTPRSPSISFNLSPNITLFKCPQNMNSDDLESYRNYTGCELFNIYYANSNENLRPPFPNGCSVLHLPLKLQPTSDSAELFERLGTDFNLQWNLSDDCINCHRKGGRCTSNRINEFRCEEGVLTSTARKRILKLVLVTVVPTATLVFFCIILFTFKRRNYTLNLKGKTQNHKDIELFLKNNENLAPRRYNYSDLKRMTNSFSAKLGEGGFASVYRGKLPDGCLVAVKILKESKGNGEEFINEVASISRTSHVNIVTLLGFCFEGSKRALIYEFMPNGSLDKFIYRKSSLAERQLGWEKLFQIAVGIAQGIEYLHQGCNTRILHFDLKPRNILLDKDYNPKISDFGLAKLCPNRSSIVSMLGARGTIGYKLQK
ncbi:Protein kinase superfamily protein [Forsythia ovata]|uniref:non-specific serine/threonine protein kinase n=1 Tax=Forsythia ovata TaxID=205694 RepID=A0ABD1TAC1_9LAMI